MEYLESILGKQNPNNWHRHENGGGWVKNTAYVAPTAFVGENGLVYGNAQVFDKVIICGNAQVFENARIYNCAKIHGNAIICENAQVAFDSEIFGDSKVCSNTLIEGGVWSESPLTLRLGEYNFTNVRPGFIKIGCKSERFEYWKSEAALKFAKSLKMGEDNAKRYTEAIDFFIKFGK